MAEPSHFPNARPLFLLDIILLLLVLYIHSTSRLFTTEPLQRPTPRRSTFLDLPPGMIRPLSCANWSSQVITVIRNIIYRFASFETTPSTITLSYGCDCRYWRYYGRRYLPWLRHDPTQEHFHSCPRLNPMSGAALVVLAHCCRQMYVECIPLYLRSTRVCLEHAPRLLSTFFCTNVEFENRQLIVVLTLAGIESGPDLLRLLQFHNISHSFGLRFEIMDLLSMSFANHMQAIANHGNPAWTYDLQNNIKHIRVAYLRPYSDLRRLEAMGMRISHVHPYLEIVFKRDRAPTSIQAEIDDLMPGDDRNQIGVGGAAYRAQAALDNLIPNLQADEQFDFRFNVEGSHEWQGPRKVARY